MEFDKMYYPVKRVLENFATKTQIQYSYDPMNDDRYELVKPKVAKLLVAYNIEGKIVEKERWVSLYKITLGTREPFTAGIIENYSRSSSFRIICESQGVVDFIVKE